MGEGGGTKIALSSFCGSASSICSLSATLTFWNLQEPLVLSSPEGVSISHRVAWLDTVSVTGQGSGFPSPPDNGPLCLWASLLPTRSHHHHTLSSVQCILVWGRFLSSLCPVWGKKSGRGGVGRQDWGLVLANPVLEAYSETRKGEESTEEPLGGVTLVTIMSILSLLGPLRPKVQATGVSGT